MLHEVFLAVALPVHGEPEITAWDDFPTARTAAAAMADDRMLVEIVVPLGERTPAWLVEIAEHHRPVDKEDT